MGKLALSQNTSLDGVMQSPGPTDVPFKYRGWAVDFDGSREGARFNYEEEVGLEEAQNSEAILLGRVTYAAMQAFWPTAEGELADRLNELPKYVVSSTLTDPSWNATVLGDDWLEEVARLRKELVARSGTRAPPIAAAGPVWVRRGKGVANVNGLLDRGYEELIAIAIARSLQRGAPAREILECCRGVGEVDDVRAVGAHDADVLV